MEAEKLAPPDCRTLLATMENISNWTRLGLPLGSGGQSEVWLVRSPIRQAEIDKSVSEILDFQVRRGTVNFPSQSEHALLFARAIRKSARDDDPSELGALKQFKIPAGGAGDLAVSRFKREIKVLNQGRSGLLRLLEWNEDERWIITEYFPQGSLEKQITQFRGRALAALTVFRSLVQAVASLHSDGIVHRDIKPANVFPQGEEAFVLGDFGIVYSPDDGDRITLTQEKVGPRDYMPPWAPIAERLDDVKPDFDVYMLGKLLWCMVAGRLKLLREYHHKPENDLERLFPDSVEMAFINRILDRCVVEEQLRCLENATELLLVIDEVLGLIHQGGQLLDLPRRCQICGKGTYRPQLIAGSEALEVQRFDQLHRQVGSIRLVPFVCNYCTHFQFFAPGYPETAAKKR